MFRYESLRRRTQSACSNKRPVARHQAQPFTKCVWLAASVVEFENWVAVTEVFTPDAFSEKCTSS